MSEQPISVAGHVEPDRVPRARGLRVRGHTVQLHRDRREPADGAGHDGEHGRLQAGLDGGLLRALPDEDLRGGGPAAGRHQHGARLRARDRRPGAGAPRPGRHPLHRLDRASSRACGGRWPATSTATARTRGSSARRAARTSSSPIPPPTRPPSSPRSSAAAFEYQGQKCSAASRAYAPSNLWPQMRDALAEQVVRDPDGRRARLPQLHGRGDRQARRSTTQGRRRAGARARRMPASSSAARPTTRRAGSSRRRSSRRRIPAST